MALITGIPFTILNLIIPRTDTVTFILNTVYNNLFISGNYDIPDKLIFNRLIFNKLIPDKLILN